MLPEGGWAGVTWSDLDEAGADAVIAAQIRRFADLTHPWEWKHYSYDQPADLPERLLAAGFTAGPAEALLVAEIAGLNLEVAPPPGVELVPVVDAAGVATVVAVHDQVFGGDHSGLGRELLAGLGERAAAVVAYAGRTPIAAARVEFDNGAVLDPGSGIVPSSAPAARPRGATGFASLWGGGTIPDWRGRGVFRAMVAHRAKLAAARGFRYLQVDALPASRPILQRLGFVELATTTPFIYSTPDRPMTVMFAEDNI